MLQQALVVIAPHTVHTTSGASSHKVPRRRMKSGMKDFGARRRAEGTTRGTLKSEAQLGRTMAAGGPLKLGFALFAHRPPLHWQKFRRRPLARPARDPTAAACPPPLKSAFSVMAHLSGLQELRAKLPLRPRAVDVSCLRANPYSSQGLRPGASRTASNPAKQDLPGRDIETFAIQAPAREH